MFFPVSLADPYTMSMPMSTKRWGLSSVDAISCCTALMCFQTLPRSTVGSTGSMPKSSAVRMWWATLPAARSALLGTHPVHRQSPPTRPRSATATLRSSVAANSAATMPPEPIPTMTRSYRSATAILLAARAEPKTCSFAVEAVDDPAAEASASTELR